jgi:hypothetical protein
MAMDVKAPMSIAETTAVMDRYLSAGHSDVSVMAPDVVFTVMATGQESRGPRPSRACSGTSTTWPSKRRRNPRTS